MRHKQARLGFYMVLGVIGGLTAWSLLQVMRSFAQHITLPGMDAFIYEGALIGLALGALLTVRTALWNHNSPSRIFSQISLGALLGACSGILSFGLGQSLLGFQFSPFWARLFSFVFLGLLLGVIAVQLRPSCGLPLMKILSVGLGGLAVGVFFELSAMYQLMLPVQLTGLLFGGTFLFLLIGLVENYHVHSYLRILSGQQEGQTYLLDQKQHLIGYGNKNDLILKGYAELCDHHARLTKQDGRVVIENAETGGEVFVNYRFVSQQSVKKGDIIKLGSALLQYHEV